MKDPWNPAWEEIREWAHPANPEPCQDWELACAWKAGYFRDHVELMSS